jgi:acetyl esterase/lipase
VIRSKCRRDSHIQTSSCFVLDKRSTAALQADLCGTVVFPALVLFVWIRAHSCHSCSAFPAYQNRIAGIVAVVRPRPTLDNSGMPNRRASAASLLLLAPLAAAVAAVPLAVGLRSAAAAPAGDWAPIARRLPPPGVKLAEDVRQKLEADLAKVQQRIKAAEAKAHKGGPSDKPAADDLLADVRIYEKAVRLALAFDEFYKAKPAAPKPGAAAKTPPADAPPRGVTFAHDLLKSANYRLDLLDKGEHPWTTAKGQVVRGYTSEVDGSAQPYGLEIPDDVDLSKPVPLVVWLHGRGDDSTDLYFVKGRDGGKRGELQPKGAICVHVFGRQCVGYKSAGEVDVLEAVASIQRRYKIDPDRVVLAGFSMGGAGAWLLGAHYADQWCAVQPGAGFVDVERYQKADPAKTPVAERALWGVNDVPDYARNLLNVPVISYSGQNDKQKASADYMEEVLKSHGRELTRFIGPNVEHKWLPLPDMLKLLDETIKKGRDPYPQQVELQTRTLRYNKMFWVAVDGLDEHWVDTRVSAKVAGNKIEVTTKNVTRLTLSSPVAESKPAAERAMSNFAIVVDGAPVVAPAGGAAKPADAAGAGPATAVHLVRRGGHWEFAGAPDPKADAAGHRKLPGLQGPIDDAFVAPFLFVAPSGKSDSPAVQKWVESEMRHQQDRWRGLMRGDPRVKKDVDVTPDDLGKYHVVCWGDPKSNKLIAKLGDKVPARWNGTKLLFGGMTFAAATHLPAMIYPNPLNPAKYVVLNSGPTFREAHDGTNSLQNPKLGDWAILDLTTPPGAAAPAGVAENGFFDEAWQPKVQLKTQQP